MEQPCGQPGSAAVALGLLPFYLALEPSPTDTRCAFAHLWAPGGTDTAVSVFLEDERESSEMFRFGSFGSVAIAWSRDADQLAFAQDSVVILRNAVGKLQMHTITGSSRWLGFDAAQRLWCLSDRRLESVGTPNALIDSVECAAADGTVAYCRRERDGLGVYLHDGAAPRQIACLSGSAEFTSVEMSFRGRFLILLLASSTVQDRAFARVIRFDIETSAMSVLLDRQLPFGFNGGPHLDGLVLPSGEVVAAYEGSECTQVWALAPGVPPALISPVGYEVFEFAADASGDRLAVIASDTQTPSGASERQLLLATRKEGKWCFCPPVRGVHQMPRWRPDGQLAVLCDAYGSWTRKVCVPGEFGPEEPPAWVHATRRENDGIEHDVITFVGPRNRKVGIILLPRLHQQFVTGAQTFFFHHLLFCIARGLSASGYTVAVLSGPGAIGRGRSRREPAGSYFVQLRSVIARVAESLRADGCHSIGLLAGSLAAVPGLRLLGPGSLLSACAFLGPLFESSIPVTKSVAHRLLDDPEIMPLDEASAQVDCPVLVVYGARDEVVPRRQIARFLERARNPQEVQLCLVENEGHIFSHPDAWAQTKRAIESFFGAHLAPGTTGDHGETRPPTVVGKREGRP